MRGALPLPERSMLARFASHRRYGAPAKVNAKTFMLFQKSKSEFEKIWTYGEDPYPPAKSDLPAISGTPEPGKLADTIG